MQDLIINTAELVKPGTVAYLKLRNGETEALVPSRVTGYDSSLGDILNVGASFSVLQYAHGMAEGLEPGAGVACFQLLDGVLYSIMATIFEVSLADGLSIKVLLPVQCRGRSLRSEQRFSALGMFTLYPDRPLERYSQTSPVPINISLGGFGLRVQNLELEPDQQVSFTLRVLAGNSDTPGEPAPVLELSGIAVARYIMQLDSEQTTYCGFQFHNLPEELQGSLAFWIKSHQALLRMQ